MVMGMNKIVSKVGSKQYILYSVGLITFSGTLNAEGSDESPITMVPSQDIPVWKGISFKQPYTG